MTIFLTDRSNFPKIVDSEALVREPYPADTIVEVLARAPELEIEIEAIAAR